MNDVTNYVRLSREYFVPDTAQRYEQPEYFRLRDHVADYRPVEHFAERPASRPADPPSIGDALSRFLLVIYILAILQSRTAK